MTQFIVKNDTRSHTISNIFECYNMYTSYCSNINFLFILQRHYFLPAEDDHDELIRDDVVPSSTDLTIDDDSNDKGSSDETTSANDAESVTGDQRAEWEYTTKGDNNSHDSTSAASSEGKKQSATVI